MSNIIFKTICRKNLHDPVSFFPLIRYYYNVECKTDERRGKYGYLDTSDGLSKRDSELKGSVHIGITNLPDGLKESLKLYYKLHPKKQMTEDGKKLSAHLKNRGRPVHATWTKYRAQMKGQKQERAEVKAFNLTEAIKHGLVEDVTSNSDGSCPELVDDMATYQNNIDTITDSNMMLDLDHGTNMEGTERKQDGKMKRPKRVEYSMIRYGPQETTAYVASQLPSVYGSTYKVLSEIKKRVPDYEPKTLLDFGSGTGMSIWAADEFWNIKEYQCVDASEDMNRTAEFLLRGSSDINVPLKVPNVYFKRFLPLSNKIKYDIVIASFALTEMPFRLNRIQAIKSLWNKTNDFLVIIEPGNNEGFDTTLQARQFITEPTTSSSKNIISDYEEIFSDYDVLDEHEHKEEGQVFAPCPHEKICARTFVETRDHPCNFSQKVELSFSQRSSTLKKYGCSTATFSYIVLRKGRENLSETGWTRILQPVKVRRRHVICELCCSNGNIEKHVLTKRKDPYVYKAARHCLKWGDMLPLDEARRPMNIRVPINPKEKKLKL